jgi:uncharacterized protein YlxP (DUF503 family)
VTVGSLEVEFLVPGASSLKEKRRVVKGLKDRIRHRYNVSVAEVDHHDKWQRATLGIACVGADGEFVSQVIAEVARFFRRTAAIQVIREGRETF